MSDKSESPASTEQNNIYWFLRDLGAAKYSGFAVNEPEAVLTLSRRLETQLAEDVELETLRETIRNGILGTVNEYHQGRRTKRYAQTEELVKQILVRIDDRQDVRDFQRACEPIVKTTEVLSSAPDFDAESVVGVVEATLINEDETAYQPEKCYHALEAVDDAGTRLQAGGQNMALVPYVTELLDETEDISDRDRSRLVSAVVQEYERRAGNKRKSDAGGVLETALNAVFDVFDVPVTGTPRHFGDFEIDNLLKTDQATIGFSCKRTLRERFRQSLTRDADIEIDEVWFIPLSTDDISREKIEDVQADGGRIYVPRDSYPWQEFGEVDELDAVRPGDEFLADLEDFTGVEVDPSVN